MLLHLEAYECAGSTLIGDSGHLLAGISIQTGQEGKEIGMFPVGGFHKRRLFPLGSMADTINRQSFTPGNTLSESLDDKESSVYHIWSFCRTVD